MSVVRWIVEKQRASQEQAVHMAGPQQKRNLQSLYETLPSPHKAKHKEKKAIFANSELMRTTCFYFPNFIYLKKNGNSLEQSELNFLFSFISVK